MSISARYILIALGLFFLVGFLAVESAPQQLSHNSTPSPTAPTAPVSPAPGAAKITATAPSPQTPVPQPPVAQTPVPVTVPPIVAPSPAPAVVTAPPAPAPPTPAPTTVTAPPPQTPITQPPVAQTPAPVTAPPVVTTPAPSPAPATVTAPPVTPTPSVTQVPPVITETPPPVVVTTPPAITTQPAPTATPAPKPTATPAASVNTVLPAKIITPTPSSLKKTEPSLDKKLSTSSTEGEKLSDLILKIIFLLIVPASSIVALVTARKFYQYIKRQSAGDAKMVHAEQILREGSRAYLWRQNKAIMTLFLLISLWLVLLVYLGAVNWLTCFAFLSGGLFSVICSRIGMNAATRAGTRTACGATESLNQALTIAFRGGAVMGLCVAGLALLDIFLWFTVLYFIFELELTRITIIMLTFCIGASVQALFARVAGGIFTKAADISAELSSQVEAGIPKDDPRNPATIANQVGHHVGDVVGMGADLFESYMAAALAAATLGVAVRQDFTGAVAPIIILALGLLCSIPACYQVKASEKATQKDLLLALHHSLTSAALMFAVLSFAVMMGLLGLKHIWTSCAILSGLLGGYLIGVSAVYYAVEARKDAKSELQETGSTIILEGLAVGMRSTGTPILIVVAAMFSAYVFAGGFSNDPNALGFGLYGLSLAAVGMLSMLAIILGIGAYEPIAANAASVAETAKLEPHVRERIDTLNQLGKNIASTGKSFAVGAAVLTALALFAAYVEEIKFGFERLAYHKSVFAAGENFVIPGIKNTHHFNASNSVVPLDGKKEGYEIVLEVNPAPNASQSLVTVIKMWENDQLSYTRRPMELSIKELVRMYDITLLNSKTLVGIFLGAMLAFLFCARTMRAAGRTARKMVEEVRRQFREISGLSSGATKPDYDRCVAVGAAGAQEEMIAPALIALLAPVIIGLLFGVSSVLGLLIGGLAGGFALAVMLANAGSIWDNARRFFENSQKKGQNGKGQNFNETVLAQPIGDPFRDTASPSLNIFIKLMCIVSIITAGLTVTKGDVLGYLLSQLIRF